MNELVVLDPSDIEKCGGEGWFSDPSTTQCYFVSSIHNQLAIK